MNFTPGHSKLNRLSFAVLCSVVFYAAASGLYLILHKLVDKVVGSPTGSAYHWAHPYSFLLVFAVSFMVILLLAGNKKITHQRIFYFIFYVLWILLSLVLSGLLWSFFDMSAGYFPQGSDLFKKIFSDMFYSLTWGCFAIVTAIPFNLLILGVSFFIVKNYKNFIENNS